MFQKQQTKYFISYKFWALLAYKGIFRTKLTYMYKNRRKTFK